MIEHSAPVVVKVTVGEQPPHTLAAIRTPAVRAAALVLSGRVAI